MRKKYIINSLFILLFIGTISAIIVLRNHGWNYANLLGNNRRAVVNATDMSLQQLIYSSVDNNRVEKLLTRNKLNNEFISYLKEKVNADSTASFQGFRILDIDGYKIELEKSLLHNSYLSAYSDDNNKPKSQCKLKNIANIDYQNRNFKVQFHPLKLHIGLYLTIFIFDIILLLVLLILALNNNSQYQIYLKSMYLIYLLKILFFFLSLLSEYFQLFYLLSQISDVLIHFVFILAIYKLLARIHIFIPRLLMLALLMNLWLDTIYIPISIYVISFALIIFSERGVKRKIYLQNLFFVLLFILSVFVILLILVVIQGTCCNLFIGTHKISSGFIVSLDWLGNSRYGELFSVDTGIVIILSILVIISLISRILKIKLLLIEHLYYWILKLYLVIMTITFTLGLWFIDYSPKLLRSLGVIILAGIAYIFFHKYLKLFPFINPVRFNVKKMLINLLNASYEHTNHNEYTQFFINFLKKIQSKTKISVIFENSFEGDEFSQLEYSRLKEVLSLNSQKKPYLNLDLELLDETEIGKQVEDFNNSDMPHLLYPIYNNKQELQLVLVFGIFPGIYWQKSLAEALYKLVEVFRGFYLNFLVQAKFLEQGKAYVKEQEEKIFNQKLWEIQTKKNEELEAERQHIMKSMEYASLIQKSILPQSQEMVDNFPEHFIIWKQRDIVGGDLYWLYSIPESNEVIFSVIDCTGHGIPGALMSVASNSALEQLVKENSNFDPGKLLRSLHQSVGNTLHQAEQNTQQDGMDMSIIKYNKKSRKLQFAGANHNLILVKASTQELIVIKGDRYSIGGLKWKNEINFNSHEIQLEKGDTIYLFSDGIVDQPYNKSENRIRRLGTKDWYNFLVENNQHSMDEIKSKIEDLIAEMIEISPQRDDICIVGIRVE